MTDGVQTDQHYQPARMARADPRTFRARTTTTILNAVSCPWHLTPRRYKHHRNRKRRSLENKYHEPQKSSPHHRRRRRISRRETILARMGGYQPKHPQGSLPKSSDRAQLLHRDLSQRSASRIENARRVSRNQVHIYSIRTRVVTGSAIHLAVTHL